MSKKILELQQANQGDIITRQMLIDYSKELEVLVKEMYPYYIKYFEITKKKPQKLICESLLRRLTSKVAAILK